MHESSQAPIGHNKPPTDKEIMDNKYSDLLERLEKVADKTTEVVSDLREKNNGKPSINSDEDVSKVAPLAKEAKSINSELEDIRIEEKKPHLEAGRAVDSYFKSHKERAERIFTTLEHLASDFQNRKIAAERAAAKAEAERREKEAQRLREEAEKAKRKETAERKLAQAEYEENRADAAIDDANASNAELGSVRSENGTILASARTVWDFTINDYDKIPLDQLRIFLSRSEVEKAIKKFANHHKEAAKLNGVTFTEKAKTQFR